MRQVKLKKIIVNALICFSLLIGFACANPDSEDGGGALPPPTEQGSPENGGSSGNETEKDNLGDNEFPFIPKK